MKAHNHFNVQWSVRRRNGAGSYDASVHLSPVQRWSRYVLAVPLALLGVVVTIFFFSAFLALVLMVGGALGIWMWWVRRQVSMDREPRAFEGVYRVVDETQMIQHTAAEAGNKHPFGR